MTWFIHAYTYLRIKPRQANPNARVRFFQTGSGSYALLHPRTQAVGPRPCLKIRLLNNAIVSCITLSSESAFLNYKFPQKSNQNHDILYKVQCACFALMIKLARRPIRTFVLSWKRTCLRVIHHVYPQHCNDSDPDRVVCYQSVM